jgi:membrane-associated protease RseP (regulator of RpoE activity)
MSLFWTLATIAVLALLIVVHELGHFLAARLQGIHVNRFSIGFGPILWKYQGPETEYAIRAFPLGGFVGFPDDDPDSDIPPNDPNLLRNRPVLDRAIVISAGVIANLIFAYFVFVAQYTAIGIPEKFDFQPGVIVPEVTSQESPAAQAGIKSGDIILSVDGQELGSSEQAIRTLMDVIRANPNEAVAVKVRRGERQLDINVTPKVGDDGVARIGVQLAPNGSITEYRRPTSLFEVLGLAAEQFQSMFITTVKGFWSLVVDFSSVASKVAGPVKIVEQGAGLASSNASTLFPFTAIISINLAIINILPLPALDGGQLAFLLVEGLRGKPIPSRIQENVMQTGLVLLLGLGIFLIVRDTAQLEVFQQLFQ